MIKFFSPKLEFSKNVTKLIFGNALAQILPLVVTPILTRLYSPEDFSALAMYVSILGIISVVVYLRFEIAIPIPNDDKTAIELLLLSLMSTCFFVLLVGLGTIFFSEEIHALTHFKFQGFLWLIPFASLLAGFYAAFQYWAIRNKAFKMLSRIRIVQSIGAASTQVGLGFLGVNPYGLVLGQVLQSGSGVLGLGCQCFRDMKEQLKQVQFVDLKNTFMNYHRFPKYSTWEAFANSAGLNLPIIIIATYSETAEAGHLLLAMRILSAPMSLVGSAMAQVFLSEAPTKYHVGELKQFTIKIASYLFKVGVFPLLVIALIAPFVVPTIFGQEWGRAGVLVSWMTPWFLIQFITSPISMVLHIVNAQHNALYLQVFGLVFRVSCVVVSLLYLKEFVIEIYAVSGFMFYCIYLSSIISTLEFTDDDGHTIIVEPCTNLRK